MTLRPLILAAAAFCAACSHSPSATPMTPTPDTAGPLRLATYNTSLYTDQAGGLVAKLQAGSEQAANIASVLQATRPDIVLINEFDFDAEGKAADLFHQKLICIAPTSTLPVS